MLPAAAAKQRGVFRLSRYCVNMAWKGEKNWKAISNQMWVYLCNQMKKVETFFKVTFIYSLPPSLFF